MKLFLCEKPSQAKDIAGVLGTCQRKDGYFLGSGIAVAWARGHLLEQAEPEAYGSQFGIPWRQEVLPVVPETWKMVVKKDVASLFRTIKNLLTQASEVIIATDADREGEVIAREILELCQYQGPVYRLWLSALDEASIRRALQQLLPGEKTAPLYQAGLGRARADWLIGLNMTRLFSVKAREMGYGGLLSVGRVQTPTLALVVRREREIVDFTPKPFWRVAVTLEHQGVCFLAWWQPGEQYCDEDNHCVNPEAAQAVVQLCIQNGAARVETVSEKRERMLPPLAFDLGTLQQAASKRWGYPADKVLEIAQSLYEKHKATTYPRTDCGYLPQSMRSEIPAVLAALEKGDPALHDVMAQLQTGLVSRVWNDAKITAHHGIIPTKQAPDLSAMNEAERNVYGLIRTHYLAQFLPAREWDVTRVRFAAGGQLFTTKGKVERVKGWSVLLQEEQGNETADDDGEDENAVSLPALSEGVECRVQQAGVRQLTTTPPSPYTDGTLIAAMKNAASFVTDPTLKKVLKENAGLGTEATRAGIISTLEARGFICRQKKALRATDVGCQLIDALPAAVTDPGMTALWEQALESVETGQLSLAQFMQKQVAWLNHLLGKSRNEPLKLNLPPMPPCPKCQGKMALRQGKKGRFWSCQRYPDCDGLIALAESKNGGARKTVKGRRSRQKKNVRELFS